MITPRRIKSIEKPETVVKLGNGTYYYNYDIQPATIQVVEDDQATSVDGYSYVQVYIYGQPNYKDCVKNIIRAYVSQDEEFDLINTVNSVNMSIIEDEEAQ